MLLLWRAIRHRYYTYVHTYIDYTGCSSGEQEFKSVHFLIFRRNSINETQLKYSLQKNNIMESCLNNKVCVENFNPLGSFCTL